jgi:hypothetical protein
MTFQADISAEDDSDLGIESFEEVLQKTRPQEAPQERGVLGKAADVGVFGPLASREGRRHLSRTGARIAETIGGLPGDVKEVFNSIMIGIPEYFAGEELPRWRQAVQGPPKGTFIGGFGAGEPTSRELREKITEPVGGEYLEPQSKIEKFSDDIAQDFAALAIPVKGKIPFARALGSSIMANSGAEVVKAFGGEDEAQAYTKMGLLFAGGLLSPRNVGAKQHIRNLYKEMEASVPEGAEVSAKNLSSKLDNIESVLRKGDPGDKSKQAAFQKITAIRDKIKDGFVDVEEVVELTKGVNESIFDIGTLKRGQNKLYDIRSALHDATKEYGAQNPEFLSNWKNANQAYAATETSRKIKSWIKRNIKPKDYLYAGSALGLEGALAGGSTAIGTAAGAGGLAATAYTAEIMKRISQSPALQKYYTNVVKNSLKENSVSFVRNMKMLDKGLQKSFEENPFETVEFD